MNEILVRLLAGVIGGILGAIFFGGLWWTIRHGLTARNPALWFLGSLLIRMGVVLGGFYLVGRSHWQRLIACLIGFVIARCLITVFTKPQSQSAVQTLEANRAP